MRADTIRPYKLYLIFIPKVLISPQLQYIFITLIISDLRFFSFTLGFTSRFYSRCATNHRFHQPTLPTGQGEGAMPYHGR